ncbi:hypothetical protein MUS1_08770 [Marinomonas ushuaiensis DSM 15871]|uniref:Uncharacterized protein n=1 Tax=Marinomonas ushuaiensis DSM 15871 TaxID=1122207 RepID=X7E0H3_9GAMM|nr:hypothetical protein [Marinomonas ushuaiensis]ETX09437.1 hypothetical protein MUS1_08770 [Marinomonas ushuaiensis DSM 15871]
MEHLQQLLIELENISLSDISEIPEPHQHVMADRVEQLHDALKAALHSKSIDKI